MPTQKYICDYCDKQFHDTPKARKRHLYGIMHQRAVKAWYDQFKDTEQEGSRRTGICTYFQRTGTCSYGSKCFFIHISPPTSVSDPNLLGGNAGQAQVSGLPRPAPAQVNPLLKYLPPSLQPPPEEGYLPLPYVGWG